MRTAVCLAVWDDRCVTVRGCMCDWVEAGTGARLAVIPHVSAGGGPYAQVPALPVTYTDLHLSVQGQAAQERAVG